MIDENRVDRMDCVNVSIIKPMNKSIATNTTMIRQRKSYRKKRSKNIDRTQQDKIRKQKEFLSIDSKQGKKQNEVTENILKQKTNALLNQDQSGLNSNISNKNWKYTQKLRSLANNI